MSGHATRMYQVLGDIVAHVTDPDEVLRAKKVYDSTPRELLGAMDAAAEEASRPRRRRNLYTRERATYKDCCDFFLWGTVVSLTVGEESQLLHLLLERAVQRRKGAGNG